LCWPIRPPSSDHSLSLLRTARREVGPAARLQHHPQPPVGAVDRVAQHPLARHAGIEGAGDHRARDLGLGQERDVLGDLGRAAPLQVLGPRLGQVEPAVDQGVPPAAGVGQEHADLAVLDPPRRAAVLPRHPGRVLALLQEAGLVHDQHGARRAEALDHIVAAQVTRRLLVPERVREHPLRAPGPRIPEVLGELPAVLALDRTEQPLEVAPGLAAGLGADEQPPEPGQQLVQLRPPAALVQRGTHPRAPCQEGPVYAYRPDNLNCRIRAYPSRRRVP
jgi:hypothetical protein